MIEVRKYLQMLFPLPSHKHINFVALCKTHLAAILTMATIHDDHPNYDDHTNYGDHPNSVPSPWGFGGLRPPNAVPSPPN